MMVIWNSDINIMDNSFLHASSRRSFDNTGRDI